MLGSSFDYNQFSIYHKYDYQIDIAALRLGKYFHALPILIYLEQSPFSKS